MTIKYTDIANFERNDEILQGSEWLFVVKSQDQIERRQQMLASRRDGRIGRIKARPVSTGLLAKIKLISGQCRVIWMREFREPRHIKKHPAGGFLITEIDCVKWLSDHGEVMREYRHPYFAFLHTIDLSPDNQRMLVVSSGYDACFEVLLETGEITWEWFAWDHGFNPDGDGIWLAVTREKVEKYECSGKKALLIDPSQFGEQGILTSKRTAHPNAAAYDRYLEHHIIISIAHDGKIYRVPMRDGTPKCICDFLSQMPHGLQPYKQGWMMTNTTRGEWWYFSSDWEALGCLSLHKLGTEAVEWIQQVISLPGGELLSLDANRGIIAIDPIHEMYTVYHPDENWCVQDALLAMD